MSRFRRGSKEPAPRDDDSEAKYRSIVENAVAGVFQTSPDGRYLPIRRSPASTATRPSSS
jgi:hypothetical protein